MPILKDGHVDAHRPQSYYDRGGWRGTWAGEGGGVLTNQCPHNLDLLQVRLPR
jgi:predicted dehydrogenase